MSTRLSETVAPIEITDPEIAIEALVLARAIHGIRRELFSQSGSQDLPATNAQFIVTSELLEGQRKLNLIRFGVQNTVVVRDLRRHLETDPLDYTEKIGRDIQQPIQYIQEFIVRKPQMRQVAVGGRRIRFPENQLRFISSGKDQEYVAQINEGLVAVCRRTTDYQGTLTVSYSSSDAHLQEPVRIEYYPPFSHEALDYGGVYSQRDRIALGYDMLIEMRRVLAQEYSPQS